MNEILNKNLIKIVGAQWAEQILAAIQSGEKFKDSWSNIWAHPRPNIATEFEVDFDGVSILLIALLGS